MQLLVNHLVILLPFGIGVVPGLQEFVRREVRGLDRLHPLLKVGKESICHFIEPQHYGRVRFNVWSQLPVVHGVWRMMEFFSSPLVLMDRCNERQACWKHRLLHAEGNQTILLPAHSLRMLTQPHIHSPHRVVRNKLQPGAALHIALRQSHINLGHPLNLNDRFNE